MRVNRQQVHQKYGGRCAYCGEHITLQQMHVDHIIPRRNFEGEGVDDIGNLNPACRVCNTWKSVWSLEAFRKEIAAQVERMRRNSAGFRLAERYGLVEATNIAVKFWFERASLRNPE